MRRHSPLLLILVLLGSLAAAQAAAAAPPTAASPTVPRVSLRDAADESDEAGEEDEAEGSESEVEDCGADDLEFGEGDEAEEEFELEADECGEEEVKNAGGDGFVSAPEACLVRRAESTVATLPGSDRIRLTVRYNTYAPTTVSVGLKLKDHKGDLTLEHATRHLGGGGVLRLTTKLDGATMERAEAAHEFDISLRAPKTPGFCGNLLEQHLRASGGKHKAGASRV